MQRKRRKVRRDAGTGVSKSALGQRLGVTTAAIAKIVAMPDWPLPSRDFPLSHKQADAVAEWHAARRLARQGATVAAGDAKARKLAAEAERAEILLAQLKEAVVDRRKMVRRLRRQFARFMAILSGLPRMAAYRLPMDSERAEAILDELITEVRDTLAEGRRYRVSQAVYERIVSRGFELTTAQATPGQSHSAPA